MEACFKAFDKDGDGSLNVNEFTDLLKALFRNEKGKPYPIDAHRCNELFMIFNQSGDGSMSKQEFAFCWNNWIKKIVRPVSALVIVDVQNDFISGNLAISKCAAGQDGEEVVEPINKLIDTVSFNLVAYSLDWHPADHLSFADNVHRRALHETSPIQNADDAKVSDVVVFKGPPVTEQILWPRHCVQETWGAELHKDLKVHPKGVMVKKGFNPDIDSYSAFFDNKKLGHTEMEQVLKTHGVTDVYCCGIAYDVCVDHTAGTLLFQIRRKDSIMVYKGMHGFVESYSCFYDDRKTHRTKLADSLAAAGVTDVFVCGLAYDVCVGSTAKHAIELGFRTILIDDASRGIDMADMKKTKQEIIDHHGLVADCHEVKAMVQGRDRRLELGYLLALQCRGEIFYPPKNKNSKYNKVPHGTQQMPGVAGQALAVASA